MGAPVAATIEGLAYCASDPVRLPGDVRACAVAAPTLTILFGQLTNRPAMRAGHVAHDRKQVTGGRRHPVVA
jgi:hypothetical protein